MASNIDKHAFTASEHGRKMELSSNHKHRKTGTRQHVTIPLLTVVVLFAAVSLVLECC
jgi:hypothetical protein